MTPRMKAFVTAQLEARVGGAASRERAVLELCRRRRSEQDHCPHLGISFPHVELHRAHSSTSCGPQRCPT